MSPLEKIRQELQDALAADLGKALALMLQELNSAPCVGEIVQQSGRYHQAASDYRKGDVLLPERDKVFNGVRTALMQLVNKLTESDLAQSASDPKLAQSMGLQIGDQHFWTPLFAKLRVDWSRINHIHLVNCNRRIEIEYFYRAYRERHDQRQGSQFFFIIACPTQGPESFAERVILQILEDYDEEERQAILVRRKPESQRLLIEKLPFSQMGMAESKRLTATYFQKRSDLQMQVGPPENFLRACAQRIGEGKRFVIFIFRIDPDNWNEYLTEYLLWLIDTFRSFETVDEGPEFLFFFPVQVRNFHGVPSATLGAVLEEIKKLDQAAKPVIVEGEEWPPSVLYDMITPLHPVSKDDVITWFEKLGEADEAKIHELLLLTLQRDSSDLTRLQRYMDEGKIDMYDMEALQASLYKYAMK